MLFRSHWYISAPRCLSLAMIALSRQSLLDFSVSISLSFSLPIYIYIYIYPSHTRSILFCVSPRLSRTRDPSFSPSFFHNFLLVQRTITVVCLERRKRVESWPVNGQTVNVWKIGRRTSFDFPTRSASPCFSFALPRTVNSSICAYFFFLLLPFFDPGRKSIIRECKRRDKRFEKELSPFETMLFYSHVGSIIFRPDIVYP